VTYASKKGGYASKKGAYASKKGGLCIKIVRPKPQHLAHSCVNSQALKAIGLASNIMNFGRKAVDYNWN